MSTAIRGSLHSGPRNAVVRMGFLFQRITAKVINPLEITELMDYATETLCLFEHHFPLSFFDIMVHLTVHIVEELEQCGPVHARWCYPMERCMGTLVGYVRNMARPEASMASGYKDDEALGFATEYFADFPHSSRSRSIWDAEEELRDSGELVMGKIKNVTLSSEDLSDIHEYVIRHSEYTAELLEEHKAATELRRRDRQTYRSRELRRHPGRPVVYPPHLQMLSSFSKWIGVHVRSLIHSEFPVEEKLIQLCKPPLSAAEAYSYMWAYGALIRCVEDESSRAYATYDSGICTAVSERTAESIEVGVVKKIYRVSFSGWSMVVVKAEWVKRDMLRRDRMGFWTCKLDCREDRRRLNPYILLVNVEQIFFMEDVITPGWHVVLRHEPRARRVVGSSTAAFGYGPHDSLLDHFRRGQRGSTGTNSGLNGEGIQREVPSSRVAELEMNLTREEDDSHYDDNEYQDDPETDLFES